MSANDYYNQKPLPDATSAQYPGYNSGQPSSPYSSSTTPPPYSSQPHLAPGDRPSQGVSPSPFETVFDDHVYPASTHQSLRTPASSHQRLNQQDTGYHGASPTHSDDMAYNHPADDIPLRDQTSRLHPKDAEMQDHVYDAPQADRPRKARVRLGELGMLGSNRKRIPFVVYFFTLVQVAVFIGEIVKNATETGSPIMIRPRFNPMIGPSPYVLVNMGARFVPCMHNVDGIQNANDTIPWPCPNATSLEWGIPENNCTLSQLCGFGGVQEPAYRPDTPLDTKPEPNQWFRFIIPMFLHGGLIHIGFNMLLQLTLGRDMEKSIGSIRFFLVYVSSGIFGFVMGGNFAAPIIASTGASGSLFGIIALTLLDLLYSWRDRVNPVKDILFILVDIVISFVLGLLPGLDNFSHIGGFLMGLALGICVLHSPNSLRRRIGDDVPYATSRVSGGSLADGTPPSFFKNPVGFFKGRKALWWAWWLIRVGALVLVTVVFILLINNFYVDRVTCDWCKYLSCLPVDNWCDIGNINQMQPTFTSSALPPPTPPPQLRV
ncbi:Inactive rhomboid protein 1 [Madurella mycetomatis]|uniref:Rhomboid-type serine protease n=1 Tax=Madurella mycetomatis TaxID=100816 RepID=A0A175VVT8_9PEZI|nr:Inactive rhomboid protein 1 [Madurella mycetomatis]